jgi:hypothetical protein
VTIGFFAAREEIMAIGWLTVLKMVPWGDVIENAPKVATGAKKLWDTVGKKRTPQAPTVSTTAVALMPPSVASLQAQITELQAALADLHQQMLQSSELIESLAEQNTQLIGRIELNRKRLLWLTLLALGLAVWLLVGAMR